MKSLAKSAVSANNDTPIVSLKGQVPLTSSLIVAEKFGKSHSVVLRALRQMECSEQFNRCNFAPIEYIDDKGRTQPAFAMTHDGFALLVMGFTGKEAMQWKEKFLAEFNRLRDIVSRVQQQPLSPDWQIARSEGKLVRRKLTDVIKDLLVPKAKEEGSANSHMLYMSYTKMLLKAMFEIEERPRQNVRDCLSSDQLKKVEVAESVMAQKIERCIQEGMPFRDIYEYCKHWAVEQYVPAIGGRTKVVSLVLDI